MALALVNGERHELIEGVLHVTPGPSDVHQLVVAAFHRRLHDFLQPALHIRADRASHGATSFPGDPMLYDDDPVGRVLSRREAIALLGTSGIALLGVRYAGAQNPRRMTLAAGGAQVSACVVIPEQTEGPYFVDEKLHRSDIRSDPSDGSVRPGAPLELGFNVSRVVDGRCVPLSGAHVDVWQCDHTGMYSDVRDPRFDSTGKKFLRGYQVTDAAGVVAFTTIYPGWYPGRAVHIHFKVRSAPSAGRGFEFTSQLYFDEALTDVVHARDPYAARGQRNLRNERDGIFRRQGGQSLLIDVKPKGDGYAGRFDVAIA